jgi:hypothetical protein
MGIPGCTCNSIAKGLDKGPCIVHPRPSADCGPVLIDGVWVRSTEKYDGIEVLVEQVLGNGERVWKLVFSEPFIESGIVSHFTEPLGIRMRKPDTKYVVKHREK